MSGSRSEQKRVGKYAVLRMLGRGGAGVVYECLDPDLDRSVAIKTLLPAEDAEGQEHLERFRREAQALARMAHPNIVRIYDYDDRSEDFPFIVMEYVEGGSLRQLLDPAHPMPPSRAATLVCQVLAGLAATHRIGVIHRDIKPGNILMRGELPLLADFGIARIADKRSTIVGTVIGTAHYMAPEQLLGGEVDHRADIWSTGVLLYQMLTGHQPFDGANALVIMDAIRNNTPDPPSARGDPDVISPALDQVVLTALAKRPEDRYPSAEAFAHALESAVRAPPEIEQTIVLTPSTPSWGQGMGKGADQGAHQGGGRNGGARGAPAPDRGIPAWVWLASGVAAIGVIGGGLALWLGSSPSAPPSGQTDPAAMPARVQPAPVQAQNASPPPASPESGPAGPIAAPAPPPAPPPAPTPPAEGPARRADPSPAFVPPLSSAPPVAAEPPITRAETRLAELRERLAAAECAVIGGTLEPGRMVLSGLGAADVVAPLRALWTTLRDATPAAGPDQGGSRFDVTALGRVTGVCEALDLVRPFAAEPGSARRPVALRIDAQGPGLKPDVGFSLSVGMPDFAGWIQVDYFSFADNAVLHVGLSSPRVNPQPLALPQAIQLNAGEFAQVFNGSAGSPGEDVVVAIASRDRLFAQPRPEIEDARAYLAALRTALAGRAPGSVAAQAIPVIIQPP